MKTNTNTKWYWTKSRKTQLTYWKTLAGTFFLAVAMIGLFQTYTERHIDKMSKFSLVSPVKAEVVEPETLEQMVERIAKEENFEWVDYFKRLIKCESNWNQYALNNNGKQLGVDRGLLQINSKFHPEVSNEQAFNAEYAIRWSMKRIQAGYQKEWTCNSKAIQK